MQRTHQSKEQRRRFHEARLSNLKAKEPLQIRLPVSVKRKFTAHAVLRGLDLNEQFQEVWEHYEQTYPDLNFKEDREA
jgi:hypothetical protein